LLPNGIWFALRTIWFNPQNTTQKRRQPFGRAPTSQQKKNPKKDFLLENDCPENTWRRLTPVVGRRCRNVWLYDNGTYTTINDPLGTNGTFLEGINDRGQIVGFYSDGVARHGFLATPVASVPGPTAGAGLPGAMLACGGLLGWWRRRQKIA
jgi:hypothetical protein